MTDTKLLREKMVVSGFRFDYIQEYLGLSRQGFLNKINNVTEFTISEMLALCDILNISNRDRENIFFNVNVDKKPT